MSRIIYIHGFLSSSHSTKAQQTKAWLAEHRPDLVFLCPDLSSYPDKAIAALRDVLLRGDTSSNACASQNLLIGSSLGGFWASYFVEQGLAKKAVLVNPAVSPHLRFADLVGQDLQHYYSDERVCLGQADIDSLAKCEAGAISKHDALWLMAQTDDEVLDYRLAVDRYQGCRQTIEPGGNHSFEKYDRWLPEIIDFLEGD